MNGHNNQVLLSDAIVTSETEDNWVWFSCQLEQDFPGSYVLVADYSKGIKCQGHKGSARNSGSRSTRCLKHQCENAKTAITGTKEGET